MKNASDSFAPTLILWKILIRFKTVAIVKSTKPTKVRGLVAPAAMEFYDMIHLQKMLGTTALTSTLVDPSTAEVASLFHLALHFGWNMPRASFGLGPLSSLWLPIRLPDENFHKLLHFAGGHLVRVLGFEFLDFL
jgi:hypothetical protein